MHSGAVIAEISLLIYGFGFSIIINGFLWRGVREVYGDGLENRCAG